MISKRFGFLLLWITLALGLGASGGVVPIAAVAHERDVIDVDVFFQPLAPFGSWIELAGYGQVWIPHHLRADWRPYTDGRWVYTEDGWMWIAEEEWGWATFHYGRWGYTEQYGWFWVPDVVWAPAWVSWQHAPGWVGWAPLPPTAVFRADIGFSSVHIDIAPSRFCFIEERWMLAPRVAHYIAPRARNVTLFHSTRNVTHYTVINNRVVNRGIPVEHVERATRRSVPRLHLVDIEDNRPERKAYVREREREVVVARPPTLRNAGPPEGRPVLPPALPPRSPDRDTVAPPPRQRLRPGPAERDPGANAPQARPEPWRQPPKTERPPQRERVTPEQIVPQEPQYQERRQPAGRASRQEGRGERQPLERQERPDPPRQQRQPMRPPQVQEQPQAVPSQPRMGQPEPSPRPPQGTFSGRGPGQPPQGVGPPPSPAEMAPPTDGRRRGGGMMEPPGSEPMPPKDKR